MEMGTGAVSWRHRATQRSQDLSQKRSRKRPAQKIPPHRLSRSSGPGRNWDSFWDTTAPTAGRLGEEMGQLRSEWIEIAAAAEAPLAVVVDLVDAVPTGEGDAGGAERLERGRKPRALGGELPAITESVGVGPQAEVRQLLAGAQTPGCTDQFDHMVP